MKKEKSLSSMMIRYSLYFTGIAVFALVIEVLLFSVIEWLLLGIGITTFITHFLLEADFKKVDLYELESRYFREEKEELISKIKFLSYWHKQDDKQLIQEVKKNGQIRYFDLNFSIFEPDIQNIRDTIAKENILCMKKLDKMTQPEKPRVYKFWQKVFVYEDPERFISVKLDNVV